MSGQFVGARSMHPRANFSASIAGRRPQTSTNDKWVCRRMAILLGGDMKKKIASLQFGDLLHTFGPLDRLFENIPSRKDDADTDMDILSQIDQLNNSHHVN